MLDLSTKMSFVLYQQGVIENKKLKLRKNTKKKGSNSKSTGNPAIAESVEDNHNQPKVIENEPELKGKENQSVTTEPATGSIS